jgi:aminobenzoyl-glutamate transport protein
VLAGIERVGNRLPNPVLLFLGLLILLGLVSTVLAQLGVTVAVPGTDRGRCGG